MMTVAVVVAGLVAAMVLAYAGRAWWAWIFAPAIVLAYWAFHGGAWGLLSCAAAWIAIAIATGLPAVRRIVIARPALRMLSPMLPKMSETERIALEAGTVWWDAELFSGAPSWKRIVQFTPQPLSSNERRFLEGPCTELCRMLDDHAIRAAGDLPPAVWEFIKRERFMGMIIPSSSADSDSPRSPTAR